MKWFVCLLPALNSLLRHLRSTVSIKKMCDDAGISPQKKKKNAMRRVHQLELVCRLLRFDRNIQVVILNDPSSVRWTYNKNCVPNIRAKTKQLLVVQWRMCASICDEMAKHRITCEVLYQCIEEKPMWHKVLRIDSML